LASVCSILYFHQIVLAKFALQKFVNENGTETEYLPAIKQFALELSIGV
jgi:hypothetical protein